MNIFYLIILLTIYTLANIYWHKKIKEHKWKFTIYSTFIVIIYISLVCLITSLI